MPDPRDTDLAFVALAEEMRHFEVDYLPDQLADPDWCLKQIATLGYSPSIVLLTAAYAQQLFGEHAGRPDGFPVYVYQLFGPRYPKRGDHSSPVFDDLTACAATALFNVVRLRHRERARHE